MMNNYDQKDLSFGSILSERICYFISIVTQCKNPRTVVNILYSGKIDRFL